MIMYENQYKKLATHRKIHSKNIMFDKYRKISEEIYVKRTNYYIWSNKKLKNKNKNK